MNKFVKYTLFVLVLLVVVVGALLSFVKFALPNVGEAENLKIDYTAERIERGQYLANAVSACMDCHSVRDWTKFSGPLKEGTLGMGGERFDQGVGMPGVFYSRNITPFALTRYTDGELFKVITTGVTKEGKAMFPLMPYPYYGRMDKEDIFSIIAYVRSLAPITNEVPASVADFPMNFIINTIPSKAVHTAKPSSSDQVAYGAYLINAAGCAECHTQVDKGTIIPDLIYGGGREFKFPDGSIVYSSNISPDAGTGIGSWTEEAFVQRFKLFTDSTYTLPSVAKGEFQTIMPWTMYARMTKEDLAAIFSYLKTVKPVSNKIDKFVAAE